MPGSHKGSKFEREVCRDLSLWFSGGEDPDIFWRSQASGARATKRGDKTLSHAAGDISASKPIGNYLTRAFFIECKHYKDLQLANFLCGRGSKLNSFWQVACDQASCYNLRPLLIARQNRFPTLIVMHPGTWSDFGIGDQAWKLANNSVALGLFQEFTKNARASFVLSRIRLTSQRERT